MNDSAAKNPAAFQTGKKEGTPVAQGLQAAPKPAPADNTPVHPVPPVETGYTTVSPALFGGKRGGKSRADGLVPGSEAAKQADRKKDTERKAAARAAERAVNPPPLPAASAPGGPVVADGGVHVGDNPTGEPGPVGGVFVAWSAKLLQRPARLLTRILDRLKKWDIMRRLDKSCLPEAVKKEIAGDIEWADGAKEDFANALAECASIELNKRGVSASQSHWVNLGLSGGELALAHFALCERIEAAILNAGLKPEPPPGASQPKNN